MAMRYLALLMLAAGCAPAPSEDERKPARLEPHATTRPAARPPDDAARRSEPAATGIEPPGLSRPRDACGAGRYSRLVGQHRREIPPQPEGATWRIACTTCPVTEEHIEHRLNILHDQASGRIVALRCG